MTAILICVLPACMSEWHVHALPGKPEEGSTPPPDLEMQKVVSYCVGVGNQTRVSERASGALSHWTIFPAPCLS